MNICLIGKYFPIQGGVSKDNQWLSLALAQAGFEVHIVTNAEEVEPAYRCLPWSSFPRLPENCSGSITVHGTSRTGRRHAIPSANPFVTKLATIATDVITTYGCDLIYSYYLEPYALAGYLASQWTGVPAGLRHAGSDVGSLFQSPEQQTAYRQVMLAADYVVTTPATFRSFLDLGVTQEKLYLPARSSLPTEYFSPGASPLDVNAFLTWMRETLSPEPYYAVFRRFLHKTFDPALPTIGIYGKVGEVKGSFDLLQALARLRARGEQFNLLALTQGNARTLADFAACIETCGLADAAWLLPFIPHWCVPQFIRACTAVCFLERDFPISIHTPLIPREVFACGICLVLSHEVAEKQAYRQKLHHGENIFLVDPHNHDTLAYTLQSIIRDPQVSQQIGRKGYEAISAGGEDFGAYAQGWQGLFQQIHQDLQQRKTMMSAAEMQTCLARLYTEDAFRTLFTLMPDQVLGDFILTDKEREALLAIDQKLLQFFATSLKMKQRERFRSAYPATFTLLEGEKLLQRVFERFYALSPTKPHEDFSARVTDFGLFLEEYLATDEQAPGYASEVARYERISYTQTYQPLARDAFTALNEPAFSCSQPLGRESRPVLSSGTRIEAFAYPIIQIVEALRAQRRVEEVDPGQHLFLFHQAAHSLQVTVFTLNQATAQLLALCDGTHTVAAMIDEMEQVYDGASLTDEVITMFGAFRDQRIIDERKSDDGE